MQNLFLWQYDHAVNKIKIQEQWANVSSKGLRVTSQKYLLAMTLINWYIRNRKYLLGLGVQVSKWQILNSSWIPSEKRDWSHNVGGNNTLKLKWCYPTVGCMLERFRQWWIPVCLLDLSLHLWTLNIFEEAGNSLGGWLETDEITSLKKSPLMDED